MPRYSHRSRTRKRNRGRFGPLFKLLCLVAVGVALTMGATVFFRVESVVISGNERYSQEEIIAASGIQVGDNLYGLNKVRIDQNIRTSLPYIGDLTINRALPNTIVITVTEWNAVARIAAPDPEQAAAIQKEMAGEDPDAEPVPLAQESWLISVKGKLLEPASEDSTAIAVTGLVPVDPQAGSVLKTADSQSQQFAALTALLEELENSGITEQVSSIRFESAYLILRYLDRFDVKMKLHADFNYNIRLTQAIQLQIESEYTPQAAGSIDLTQEYGAVYSPAPSQDIS